MRWVAYMAGFGGGREQGLQLVEDAAAYPGDNQEDARFALVLLYNREKRYDDALTQLATLRERYPRNRLVWLETRSTSLRAGKAGRRRTVPGRGHAPFASDTRPRMFGEDALWYYKRGAARGGAGPHRGGPRRSGEGADARGTQVGARPRALWSSASCDLKDGKPCRRQRTFADSRPSV